MYLVTKKRKNKFELLERSAYGEQTIMSFKTFAEAQTKAKHLIRGGGFNGHTPPFFINNVKKK